MASRESKTREELLAEIHDLQARIRAWEHPDAGRGPEPGRLLPAGQPYRLLKDAEADFVFVQDLDTTLTAISTLAESFLNYRIENWARLWTGAEAITPAAFEACRKAFNEMETLARNGQPPPHAWRVNMEFVRRDGSTVPTETTFTFVHGRDGQPTAIVGVARDLSRETRTETVLRYLSRQLLDLQELERRNIARELHDEVGQALTGIKLTLAQARKASGQTSEDILGQAQSLIDDLMVRVSEISRELRPSVLDDLGVLAALRWYFARYEKQTSVKVRFSQAGQEAALPQAVETAIYRIVQEALTNVARHSGAKLVEVKLAFGEGSLSVEIADNGRGFDPAAKLAEGKLSGVVGMRERALSLGGDLQVRSRPGEGTSVYVSLPLDRHG